MIDYTLSRLAHHRGPQDGRCALEWISYVAYGGHDNHPACVDEAVRGFVAGINDCLDDENRQKLRPLLARCIGTAGDGRHKEYAQAIRNLGLSLVANPDEVPDVGWSCWYDAFYTAYAILNANPAVGSADRDIDPVVVPEILAALDRMLPTVLVEIPAEGQVELDRLVSA